MSDEQFRRKIKELEDLHTERFLIVGKKITEAIKAGKPVDPRLIDSSGMKERHLEALYVYGHLGLTPRELYEKRFNWLWHPSDVLRKNRCAMTTYRIKTISTFLNRLRCGGLVCRKKEGRTYRYFLKESGRKRLRYYKKPDKEEKTKINEMDMWLFERLVSTSMMIENIRSNHLLIGVLSQSIDPNFWKAYCLLWGKMQGLLNSLRSLQLSILLDSDKLAKFAVTESTRSLQELQSMQKVIIACLVY